MQLRIALIFVVCALCALHTVKAKPANQVISGSQVGLDVYCALCSAAVGTVKDMLKWGMSREAIAKHLLSLCEILHLEKEIVCKGLISEFKVEFITALNGSKLSDAEDCVLVAGNICSGAAHDPPLAWSVKLPNIPKPSPSNHTPAKGAPKLRILQLADIHLDSLYTPGSSTNCGLPLCCQSTSGRPSNTTEGAGYWGSLHGPCDVPERTIDNLFAHLSKNERFDMIYWTGDLPAHDIWQQSREQQLSLLKRLTDKLLKYFPNIPIYSSVGNHESFPADSYPPPYVTGNQSESWLYDTLAQTWSHWLPASTMETIKYGGFYTVLVKPGFRIISLNTNFCERQNFWLLLNVTDPAHELQWLVSVLQSAELNGEKVHLLGHVPPGVDDCIRVWSENLNKIIVRYSNTIAGYFLAHTHQDEFELFYDPSSKQPVAIGYLSPSVTTFIGLNPGYRIYTVDGFYDNSTWGVLDHETKILNLTRANTENITIWQHEYFAKADYQLADLSPRSWHDFTLRLASDDDLFQSFYKYYKKMGAGLECDQACRKERICALRTSTSGDKTYC
ncbi:sphingomyelin phosphodiesterase-like [Watersipora subatra]|uniref:sphingomyelin phosphodiesterase-like n=1 Tax=Watersipora subatra TaxID=2589382 RepID=UPI00355C5854